MKGNCIACVECFGKPRRLLGYNFKERPRIPEFLSKTRLKFLTFDEMSALKLADNLELLQVERRKG